MGSKRFELSLHDIKQIFVYCVFAGLGWFVLNYGIIADYLVQHGADMGIVNMFLGILVYIAKKIIQDRSNISIEK